MNYFTSNLKFLRAQKGLMVKEIAAELGYKSPSRYSNYEKGHSNPEMHTLIKLSTYFGISIEDLIRRNLAEEQFKLSEVREDSPPYGTQKREILTVTVDTSGNTAIPVINTQVAAGWATNAQNPSYFSKLPAVTMPMPEYKQGDWALIQVRGDSMEPTIHRGQWLMCRRLYDYAEIKDNNLYVVLLTDGPVVKRVLNRVKKRGTLVLQSDNPSYDLVEVSFTEDVLQVWVVQMAWVFDLHNRTLDIMREIQSLKEELMLLKRNNKKEI